MEIFVLTYLSNIIDKHSIDLYRDDGLGVFEILSEPKVEEENYLKGNMKYYICRLPPYVMRCAIWCHLYNLKNVKNTHGGVLILVKLQASPCIFTKIITPPWVFFTLFKLHKWYQIAQRTTYNFSFEN